MPEHDFLNPYKNQNPGDIKIIDTADKNISAASPAPKKAVSEKVKTETLPAAEASTYLFPHLSYLILCMFPKISIPKRISENNVLF